MKKVISVALLMLFTILVTVSRAQSYPVPSASFTFGPGATCSTITSLNGAPTEQSAGICLHQGDPLGGYGSFIDVPFELGFLNEGYLAGCDPIAFGPKVYTLGDGTHAGDKFTVSGSTTCPYYTGEYGAYLDSDHRLDGFSVTANYIISTSRVCGRFGCHTYLTTTLTGGTGEVVETLIN
jgi:hypothetical protein